MGLGQLIALKNSKSILPFTCSTPDSKDSGTVSSEDGDVHHKMQRLSESRPGSTSPDVCNRSGMGGYPLYHPANLQHYRPSHEIKHTPGGSTNSNINSKPRIWSLADMASKDEKDSPDARHAPASLPPGLYPPSAAGKIISPLPSRMHYNPYMGKDLYRNFNSSMPSHVRDYALLESYQRALESVHPLSVISKSMESNGPSFAPLSLTTNNNNNNNHHHHHNHTAGLPTAGVSPSTSSTSSSRPENTTPLSAMPSMDRSMIETNAISTPWPIALTK